MLTAFAFLALLTVTDPSVGPAAADSLTAPTSALYRNLAPFDLQEVTVLDSEKLELSLRLGSYANPLGLANGFSHPIIEIYIGGGAVGAVELLPGSGMVLPDGESWTYAFQLTGDHVRGFRAEPAGVVGFTPELQLLDDQLYITTSEPPIEEPRLAAITGLYSPFHDDGWRPLSAVESPWAFSSTEQRLPVVDVLALTEEAQQSALSGGVLPVTEVNTIPNPNTIWFALMAAGIGLAGVGLIMRGFSSAAAPRSEPAAPDDAHDTGPVEGVWTDVTEGDDVAEVPAEPAMPQPEAADQDASENDEPAPPRVGLFRGSDQVAAPQFGPAPAVAPADDPELSHQEPEPAAADMAADDYPLPELGAVDFGEFIGEELPDTAEEAATAEQPAEDEAGKRTPEAEPEENGKGPVS